MKELREVARAYREARARGERCALATVVRVRGSAYRRPGARMLVTEAGETVGGVSGGCLETDVVRKARLALLRDETRLVTYDTTDEDDIDHGAGTGCRGVVEVLVEPLPPDGDCHLARLETWLASRRSGVVATVLRNTEPAEPAPGARLLIDERGDLSGDLTGGRLAGRIAVDAARMLRGAGRSRWETYAVDGGAAELFLERIEAPQALLLCGGGRDAVPLARIAGELGWYVTVVDGRPGYATRSRFPGADAVLTCPPDTVLRQVPVDARTAVVVMSHHYGQDRALLRVLLPSPACYIGLLGPRSRAERLLAELAGSGFQPTQAELARLHAPVGLDIGAETPEEIALSILAEIRSALFRRSGRPLRERAAPIHAPEPDACLVPEPEELLCPASRR